LRRRRSSPSLERAVPVIIGSLAARDATPKARTGRAQVI
jgi:hypothetical protein